MELELSIRKFPRPYSDDTRELVEFLLRSLGFERNVSMYREIILKLLEGPETSTEISEGLGKRTTVVYHVGKLQRAGIIIRRGSRYMLREGTFERIVEEIKRDVDRVFEDLVSVARRLDRALGLPRR